MKKVLLVEDDRFMHEWLSDKLNGKVELISAFSIEEAEQQFAANPDIAAIVMDACVPGNRPTTPPLVRKFRETFTGPMIAASTISAYKQMLIGAGCDHECEKENVPAKVLQVLGL